MTQEKRKLLNEREKEEEKEWNDREKIKEKDEIISRRKKQIIKWQKRRKGRKNAMEIK